MIETEADKMIVIAGFVVTNKNYTMLFTFETLANGTKIKNERDCKDETEKCVVFA